MTGPRHAYTTKDGKRYARVAIAKPVCDFCLSPNPTWAYPAEFVPVSAYVIFNDVEHWSACDTCHDLLEADDLDGLIERVIAEHPTQPPSSAAQERMRRNILRFLNARTGPPTRT